MSLLKINSGKHNDDKDMNTIKINKISQRDIAIIGISVKFPMGETTEQLWSSLINKLDCIKPLPENRRADIEEYLSFKGTDIGNTKYVEGAYLNRIDSFDYAFFQLSPAEANLMDPNQRLFLETAWSAVEDAGYGGGKLAGSKTGVYVGYDSLVGNRYSQLISEIDPSLTTVSFSGNLPAIIPSRIAYILDLNGPSILIDTACSSSLVAVHLACQGIRSGDSEAAIVGSVSLNLFPIDRGEKLGIESSNGRSKTFDDSSDGIGIGEGMAAILLKPLGKAVKDNDNIYAVIKGSAINQDGNSVGITAPNVLAQESVIVSAWQDAGVAPDTITYIEAHGTGTKLGDPIEIEGIQRAFRRYTDRKQFCAIGSIKTNIGHLNNAAGIAGLLKGVLALKYKELPPSIHFNKPNNRIIFEQSPVYVNDKRVKWETESFPRRCGISSFGLSGTNCHLILEEAAETKKSMTAVEDLYNVLTISAKSIGALIKLIEAYRGFMQNTKDDLGDICYTANTGRGHYCYRLALIIKRKSELQGILESINAEILTSNIEKGIFFKKHKISINSKEQSEHDEITENQVEKLSAAANQKMKDYKKFNKSDKGLLSEICELYVNGAEIDWEELYDIEVMKKVSLPAYQYENNRCWIKIPNNNKHYKSFINDDFYYKLDWENIECTSEISNFSNNRKILIFLDEKGIGEKLARRIKNEAQEVIEIIGGKQFDKVSKNKYISGNSVQDYEKLFNDINRDEIDQIILLNTITKDEEIGNIAGLEEVLKKGVYNFFYLIKAILNNSIGEIRISIISEYVNEVTGNERIIKPENAALFGLGKVTGIENPNLIIKCIDVDENTEIDEILSELKHQSLEYQVAYRYGKRYLQKIKKLDMDSINDRKMEVKENGIYVITGGTGGIGLEICKYLADENKVNLALINRSHIPERTSWENILNKKESSKLNKIIKTINEIEKKGSRITCYSADVSNETEIKAVLEELRNKYERLDGIIHSAGVAGNGFLVKKDYEIFTKVLDPKVKGTWILEKLTRKDNMDFFIIFSSLTAITGGLGQSDYTAANAYIDSFAAYKRKRNRELITINWTTWKDTGMAMDFGTNTDGIFKAISTESAISAFNLFLHKHVNNSIIGELNYESEILYSKQLPILLCSNIKKKLDEYRNSKQFMMTGNEAKNSSIVKLMGKNDGDYSEMEKKVAHAWAEVLGFEEININDSFYQLGGDSILALKIANNINKHFDIISEVSEILRFPTVREFAANLDEKLQIQKDKFLPLLEIEPVKEKQYYTLSSAQRRIFILSRNDSSSIAYNMPTVMIIQGNIDRLRFESAFRKLVNRHETLRTSFELKYGEPVQIIHKNMELQIQYQEIDESDDDDNLIVKRIVTDFVQPFELSKAPLVRVRLAKLKENRHIMLLDMHHIIADGTSEGILMKDFVALYEGSSLPGLKLHYKDYCEWQKKMLKSDAMKSQETYWTNIFSKEVPVMNIPTDFPRPLIKSFEGSRIFLEIDEDITRNIQLLALSTETTLFMLLLAAYNVLLFKYTGQDDIVVGTSISVRPDSFFNNVIGMFVNTTAIRNHIQHNIAFREFLGKVKDNTLKAFENRDYQIEDLIDKLKLPRNLSRNNLFDTMLVLQNMDKQQTEIRDLKFIPYRLILPSSKFDITLYITEAENKLIINLEYCTKLFNKDSIQVLGERYISILKEVTENQDIMLSDISRLNEGKASIITVFNEDLDNE